MLAWKVRKSLRGVWSFRLFEDKGNKKIWEWIENKKKRWQRKGIDAQMAVSNLITEAISYEKLRDNNFVFAVLEQIKKL